MGKGDSSDRSREEVDSLRLVRRIQAGESQLLAALYERYLDRLYRYLSSILGPRDAEDALQEVFERVLQALPRYVVRPDSSFGGWLFRIARNVAIDHLRARGRTELLSPEELWREIERQEPQPSVGGQELTWLSDRQLVAALRSLNELQREIVLLRYAVDLTLSEIAAVVGAREAAVRQAHRRALRTLHGRLAALDERSGQRRRRPLPMVRLSAGMRLAMGHSFSRIGP